MNKKIIAAVAAALVMPAAASAVEFGADHSNMNYSYAELGYSDVDYGDGIGIEGSYQVTEQFFAFGSYDSWGGDGYDLTTMFFGAGSSMALNDKWDAYGKFGLMMAENEFKTFDETTFRVVTASVDDTGFAFEIGVRGNVIEKVEAFGNLQYSSVFDGQTGFEIGGRYWLKDNLGVSLSLFDIEDSDGFTLAGRYTF